MIKIKVLFIFFIFFLLISSGFAQEGQWVNYQLKDEKVAFELPGDWEPEVDFELINSEQSVEEFTTENYKFETHVEITPQNSEMEVQINIENHKPETMMLRELTNPVTMESFLRDILIGVLQEKSPQFKLEVVTMSGKNYNNLKGVFSEINLTESNRDKFKLLSFQGIAQKTLYEINFIIPMEETEDEMKMAIVNRIIDSFDVFNSPPIANSVKSFNFFYKFGKQPGNHFWKKVNGSTWTESYPDGSDYNILAIKRIEVEGDKGILLRHTTYPFEYFIPDKGSKIMYLRIREIGKGWGYLGEMKDIK